MGTMDVAAAVCGEEALEMAFEVEVAAEVAGKVAFEMVSEAPVEVASIRAVTVDPVLFPPHLHGWPVRAAAFVVACAEAVSSPAIPRPPPRRRPPDIPSTRGLVHHDFSHDRPRECGCVRGGDVLRGVSGPSGPAAPVARRGVFFRGDVSEQQPRRPTRGTASARR